MGFAIGSLVPFKRVSAVAGLAAALFALSSCSGDDPVAPSAEPPTVSTAAVSALAATTAQCGGTVSSDGGAAVTARGVCWSTTPTPTMANDKTADGTGTGSYVSAVSGLSAGTTYRVRAYAENSAGVGYGNVVQFETPATLTDVDGNSYQTVKIGSQWWMAENLRVTHYRNGDPVPNITVNGSWSGLSTGAYGDYANTPANSATYGRLYNWFAVADPRGLAPAGWHVATDAEWQTLVDQVGGESVAGGALKEAGPSHWTDPNTGATNGSGFTALPAGYRYGGNGNFFELHESAMFWSATEYDATYAWNRELHYNDASAYRDSNNGKENGFSVRCVRD